MNQMDHTDHMDEMGIEIPQWVTLPICDRWMNSEIAGEYQLPDYQPEIRRLLSVTPTVLPPAKYVGSSQIELNGTVDYQVLYVGGDGGLYSVPLSSEYNLSVPIEADATVDTGAGVSVFVSNLPETVSTRVSAPRKLSIRCRMRSHVCAYGKMLLEERCRGTASPSSIRRRTEQARTMRAASGLSEPVTLQAELLGVGEDARVIAASAVAFVADTSATEEGVGASGEVLLKLMLGREDGRVETISRKLPFSGEVELEEPSLDASLRASGSVSDLSVSVEEGRILCDVGVLLEARSLRNCPIHYTADLYSTEVESQCRTEEYALPVVRKCENANLSQSERLSANEYKIPENAQILDAWGCAQWDACENAGGKYILSGQSKYTLLCQKEEEFSTVEILLPLRYETDGEGGDAVGFDACSEVLSCRARLDGDVLSLDAELSVIADFLGRESVSPVVEAEFGEAVASRGCGMTVYYPSADESVWDVAKKYRISPEQLSEKKGKAAYYLF